MAHGRIAGQLNSRSRVSDREGARSRPSPRRPLRLKHMHNLQTNTDIPPSAIGERDGSALGLQRLCSHVWCLPMSTMAIDWVS